MSMYRRRLMIANALKKSSGINYPGLIAAWSAKGKTNDDEDRAILKDLTGNGHDIHLVGFAFSEMSGYGGYNLNFKNCNTQNNESVKLKNNSKIVLYNTDSYNSTIWKYINGSPAGTVVNIKSYKVKISGLSEGEYIVYDFNTGDDFKVANKIKLYNGVNTIPEIYGTVITDKISYTTIFQYGTANVRNKELTIELLPEYPDALVFDGVNDRGSTDNMPIIEDYTIIVKRKLINDKGMVCAYGTLSSSNSNLSYFWFEYIGRNMTTSLGYENYIEKENIPNLISYQSKNSYNGIPINNSELVEKGTKLSLGSLGSSSILTSMAFYSAYLFDRSLDEQEIKEFIRKYIDPEYLLPSEIPTPDCYYDFSLGSTQGATREDIIDQSGNGNDAKAYNFNWSNMSGYNGYYLTGTGKRIITNITGESNILGTFGCPANTSITITITGIPEGATVISRATIGEHFRTTKDGTYHIGPFEGAATIAVLGFTGECNMEITEDPQYPGALVLDGTDDYIALDAFDSGFKTIFMLVKPFKLEKIIYDQRYLNSQGDGTCIYINKNTIAYYAKNQNGETFINGKLNKTTYVEELVNRKQLITQKMYFKNSGKPVIGKNMDNNNFSGLALYKFLGFKDELTEEQIQAIIKKYNLLDGVDEIEVS